MWTKLGEEDRGFAFLNSSVILEEEYKNACRMTLEKLEAGHCAITCTVYGVMIHTVVVEEACCMDLFESMKKDLALLIDLECSADEKAKQYESFTLRYHSFSLALEE